MTGSRFAIELFEILCSKGMNEIDQHPGSLKKFFCTYRIKEIDLFPDKPFVPDTFRDFLFCPV